MKVNYSDERHEVLVSGKYYFFVTVKKDNPLDLFIVVIVEIIKLFRSHKVFCIYIWR